MLLSEYIYIYKVICKFESQRVELWTTIELMMEVIYSHTILLSIMV